MYEDLFKLSGEIAVVIGGAGGIGSAIAEGFSEYGAKVVIADMKLEDAKRVAAGIKERTGGESEAMYVDVTDEVSTAKLRDSILSKFGAVDILVNSQGVNAKHPATEFPLKDWEFLYNVNVKGVMITCREFGKPMVERRKGKIINLSSVRGSRATKWSGNIGYSSTKGAVDMLTRQLAAEWAPYNVNVNAIAPSLVATQTGMGGVITSEHVKMYAETIPMGRIATLRDIVGAALFLASPASDYMTGQIIYVDGGLTAVG